MDGLQRLGVEPVQPLPALIPHVHRPHLPQHPQVPRDLGLGQAKELHQLVHRALTLGKGVQDLPTAGFSNRVESVRSRRCPGHALIIYPYGYALEGVAALHLYSGSMPTPPSPLPALEELLAGAHVVSLPMRVKFRGIMARESLLLQGPAGWGEFCPFPEYGDAEASRWLAAAIEAAWTGFPAPLRPVIPVNATVPAVRAEKVPEVLARFGRVDAVKVKVAERGQTLDDDAARLSAVRSALPDAAIRVDANGGWDVPAAVEALTRLANVGLEYAEQPVPTIDGLAEVRRALRAAGTPVLIAADESVRKESDPLRVARAGAADLIVVKVAPLGGVRRALDIVTRAGLPAVVSSALDTSVGIRAGLALAAALPELPYACGLGTVSLFESDITMDPLVADDGAIRLRDVAADAGLLEQYAAPPERRDWWLARLRRVHALLTA